MTLADLANRVVLSGGWRRRGIALGSGAFSALAMAPFNLWPVLVVTFPVFVWLLDGAGSGRRGLVVAFGTGWWFGFGYFIAGLYWIGMALFVEADKFAWLLPFAVLGIPAGLAFFTAFGALLARAMWTTGPLRILVFAAGLTIAEFLRGTILTGFPWNSFGYALTSVSYFAQGASLVGLWGLTLFALVIFASPATIADARDRTRHPYAPVALSLLALFLLGAYGWHRLANNETTYVEGVRLRLMQPNISQNLKWQPDQRPAVMRRYLSLSDQATSPERQGVKDITHLIWPESAFPFFLDREPQALAQIGDLLPSGVSLITGAIRIDAPLPGSQQPRVFNSIRVLRDDGAIIATYDKLYLVPFGEFLPFQTLLESIGLQQLTRVRGGFTPGTSRRALAIPGLPPAAPLICYEAIYPGYVLPQGERPRWILNLTNDAWFGITPGPYQHFAQARLRAIEEGLPLVRVANNGISAIVDPLGRVLRSLSLGSDGLIDGALPQPLEATVYARHRNGPVLFLIAAVVVATFAARRRNNVQR
ncbi:MAG TPA: apolipoprotein N-acyltransferase [Xanthobacteraceae bacterium]|nr:apolipoprotein N-acyltransferase [Xanthobacteraceae bacterium]